MRPASHHLLAQPSRRAAAVLIAVTAWWGSPAAGAPVDIARVRYWTAPDHTRVVLDLGGPVAYEVRRASAPDRIVVDVTSARFRSTAPLAVADSVILQLRHHQDATRAQLVIELEEPTTYRHFALGAAEGRPHRIVVDVHRPLAPVVAVAAPAGDEVRTGPPPNEVPGTAVDVPAAGDAAAPAMPARPIVVIIDPGHGGMDPGAVRGNLKEKDIALDIALEMARLIDATPGFRAVLTRKGDYFISLAERVRIAQRSKGDVFISIHCNTHRKPDVAGMEVYFLSLQGATDREAQELADKENAADLVGLAPDEAHDDSVLSILMDLRMTRVLDQSSRLAERILAAARASNVVGARKVKQARFQVLRSLAMPSALVEVAYLSHAGDRNLLDSAQGRRRLARVVADGLLDYRGVAAAPVLAAATAPVAWTQRYRVRRGDSLWRLAERHGTTMDEIYQRNNLRSRELRIGQTLHLPAAE